MMKDTMKKFVFGFAFFLVCVFCFFAYNSCTNSFSGFFAEKSGVSIVSYNAQTFFDAVEDGNEFSQFKGSKTKWSAKTYADRLSRLKEAAELASFSLGFEKGSLPDILVLQEIESIAVIEDFCKLLPLHNSYEQAVFFPPKKGGAFSTVVLSKFPITETKRYNIYCAESKLRPLIEVRILSEINGEKIELALFSVHWKSKTGKVDSRPIRAMQEKQLYQRIKKVKAEEPETPIIVCGDFNQPFQEFSVLKEFPNCWNVSGAEKSLDFEEQSGNCKGSYFFRDKWEGIDHFFYSENLKDGKGLELEKFAVINSTPLINEDGTPNAYRVFSGKGYSDHLPIGIVLKK